MDIEGELLEHRPRLTDVILWLEISSLFCHLISLICQGCEFLLKHKKRAFAAFYLVLEAISLVFDVVGKGQRSFLLAAFLVSAFGFAMTFFTCLLERTRLQSQRQLGVIEFVFSTVELIDKFLAVLGVKDVNNYSSTVVPLVFGIIFVVLSFKTDEESSDTSRLTNDSLSLEHLHINASSITANETEQIMGTNIVDHHVNSVSSANDISSVVEPLNLDISDPQNRLMRPMLMYLNLRSSIQKLTRLWVPGAVKILDQLRMIELNISYTFDQHTTYWRNYLETFREIYNIEVQFRGAGDKLLLGYPDDAENKMLPGDDQWDMFCTGVKSISMRRRMVVDSKLKPETKMAAENLEEDKSK